MKENIQIARGMVNSEARKRIAKPEKPRGMKTSEARKRLEGQKKVIRVTLRSHMPDTELPADTIDYQRYF